MERIKTQFTTARILMAANTGKFDKITKNHEINRILYSKAKEILIHALSTNI